jgi:hypothetical protein
MFKKVEFELLFFGGRLLVIGLLDQLFFRVEIVKDFK